MNIKKEQHVPLISQHFSKKADVNQVTSENDTAVGVLQFIKNKNCRYKLYRYMGIDISVYSFGLHFHGILVIFAMCTETA